MAGNNKSKIAEAFVELRADKDRLKGDMARFRTELTSRVGAIAKGAGRMLAAGLGAGLIGVGDASLKLFAAQEAAEIKLAAVIKATGGAAKLTAKEMRLYAGELQKVSTFGDEATLEAMALMATFKEIKGPIFKDAIRAAQDMSAVLGSDMKGAAMQLGKALNDPLIGMSALAESGVSFTADQKEMVKQFMETNQVAKAQAVILAEMEAQFGGTAAAMRDTLGGSVIALKNSVGDLGETIGGMGDGPIRGYIERLREVAEATNDLIKLNETLNRRSKTGGVADEEGKVTEARDLAKAGEIESLQNRLKAAQFDLGELKKQETKKEEFDITDYLPFFSGGGGGAAARATQTDRVGSIEEKERLIRSLEKRLAEARVARGEQDAAKFDALVEKMEAMNQAEKLAGFLGDNLPGIAGNVRSYVDNLVKDTNEKAANDKMAAGFGKMFGDVKAFANFAKEQIGGDMMRQAAEQVFGGPEAVKESNLGFNGIEAMWSQIQQSIKPTKQEKLAEQQLDVLKGVKDGIGGLAKITQGVGNHLVNSMGFGK